MQHFSCDLCHQQVDDDDRYTVEIAVAAVQPQTALAADDLSADNLDLLANLLQQEQDGLIDLSEFGEDRPTQQSFRYDLCSQCHRRYTRDPLGQFRRPRLQFSDN